MLIIAASRPRGIPKSSPRTIVFASFQSYHKNFPRKNYRLGCLEMPQKYFDGPQKQFHQQFLRATEVCKMTHRLGAFPATLPSTLPSALLHPYFAKWREKLSKPFHSLNWNTRSTSVTFCLFTQAIMCSVNTTIAFAGTPLDGKPYSPAKMSIKTEAD